RYHLPKLNQDQLNNLSKPITPREIGVVIKSLQTIECSGPNDFICLFVLDFGGVLQDRITLCNSPDCPGPRS
ncbi:hypothetical protein ACQP3J_27970, partial [Escherichia coli]